MADNDALTDTLAKNIRALLAKNIRALLASTRTTQKMLAGEVGADQSQVSKWVRGQTIPTTVQLVLLAKYFGVLIDDLVFNDLSNTNPHEVDAREQILKIVEIIGIDEAYRRLVGAKTEPPRS